MNVATVKSFIINTQLIIYFIFSLCDARAQTKKDTVYIGDSISVAAGKQYADRSPFYQKLFGRHYRQDWAMTVAVPVLYLDKLAGGLTPYLEGGGRQTKTLRLQDKQKKEYVLRSVDKSFGKLLPEIYHGTFVEDVMDDQVSTEQPYAALTIPGMAKAANIYHTNPVMGYVPAQPRLDTLNGEYGNMFYLFEQRPDENWEEASNFGNAKNIINTENLLEELIDDNENQVDQLLYVRSRLFDMFIGDWGRHEDQWRWGEFKKNGRTIYKPIPRDRDQTYTKFDGIITSKAARAHHQTFDHDIKDVLTYNFAARDLDRRMANETTLDDWVKIARELQQSLTDNVIENGVKKLPPEIYAISGKEITEKLKSRRTHLVRYAGEYYRFLAKQVDIPGSEEEEYFTVQRLNDNETLVEVYKIDRNRKIEQSPLYRRVFKADETKEIRLYGIEGKDTYNISGRTDNGIKLRIIGGIHKDSIIDYSLVENGGKKTIIYDNPGNYIENSGEVKLDISEDTAINRYRYDAFEYDKTSFVPLLFYNYADRFHVGIGYKITNHKWRKEPYFFKQSIFFRYSISQNAIGATYEGTFTELIGKWNLAAIADYDAIRWTNFFGLGNETEQKDVNRNYYRVRTAEILGNIGINRTIAQWHTIALSGFFQSIKIINDKGRFLETVSLNDPFLYKRDNYAGAAVNYDFVNLDDLIVPTKGFSFNGGVSYTHNLREQQRSFARLNGVAQSYIPLIGKFSLGIAAGGATITGTPEFYQYPTIGGSRNFRGFRRDRFRGKTAFFNNNELQWLTDFRSKVVNGKVGLLVLVDNGRVWLPGEVSDVWHVAYGAGVIIAPFNLVRLKATYSISEDGGTVSLRVNRFL